MIRGMSKTGSTATSMLYGIAALALFAAGVWYFMLRSTPERTVEAFLQAQAERDMRKMENLLTEDSKPWVTKIGQVTTTATESNEPAYEIGASHIDGDRATVPVTYPLPERAQHLTESGTFRLDYVLYLQENQWRIDLETTMKSLLESLMRGGEGMAPPPQTMPNQSLEADGDG